MNLSVKRIALLFSVASAILTTACDDPKEIGLPQGQPLGVFVTENIPLTTSTVLADSVITFNSTQLLAGRYANPKLGPVMANAYFRARYNGGEFTAENATRADKAELLLPYSYFYGDTTVPYRVTLHLLQLKDSIQNRAYLGSEVIPYDPTPVGEAAFTPTFSRRDTLKMTLSDAVAQQLLSFANQSDVDFRTGFAGFALVGDYATNRVVLGYRATSEAFGRIRLSYQTSTAQTYDFLLFGNRVVNHIRGDQSGTAFDSLTSRYSAVPSTRTNGETFVQGGTGIMTRIEFPDLSSLEQQGKIAINKAELVVTPLPGNVLSSRSRLILYDATGDGRLLRLNDEATPQFILGDIIAPVPLAQYVNNAFTFNITRYVADVLQNKRSNNGLYLSLPSPGSRQALVYRVGVSADISLEESVSTISLGGPDHPTAPIKLRIYYTPVTAN